MVAVILAVLAVVIAAGILAHLVAGSFLVVAVLFAAVAVVVHMGHAPYGGH